jgi:hypothetical protein
MAAVFEHVCGKEVNLGSWRHLAQIRPALERLRKCAPNLQHPPQPIYALRRSIALGDQDP